MPTLKIAHSVSSASDRTLHNLTLIPFTVGLLLTLWILILKNLKCSV